jgi:hypothetical protein
MVFGSQRYMFDTHNAMEIHRFNVLLLVLTQFSFTLCLHHIALLLPAWSKIFAIIRRKNILFEDQ